MSTIRALGITDTGTFIPICTANNVRGLTLSQLVISTKYVQWFKDNKEVLNMSVTGSNGIIFMGPREAVPHAKE